MKSAVFSLAVLALGASTLAASAASPAAEQLAAKLGLNADAYSLQELTVIDAARLEGDTTTANFYVAGKNRAGLPTDVSPGRAQLAASLGLDPAKYSQSELEIIDAARHDNDAQTVAFYTAGSNHDTRGGLGEVSPGKAQLAAALGVNPADYTLDQLTAAYLDRIDG